MNVSKFIGVQNVIQRMSSNSICNIKESRWIRGLINAERKKPFFRFYYLLQNITNVVGLYVEPFVCIPIVFWSVAEFGRVSKRLEIHCELQRWWCGFGWTNHFPANRKTTEQPLHPPSSTVTESYDWIEWSTDYSIISIPAFHGRLKAYYWRNWDHRNLLHVWPFKAFHRDGSQVRIYWNQFLSESSMLAHQHNPVKHSLYKGGLKKRKSKRQTLEKKTNCWKQVKILRHSKCLCPFLPNYRDFEKESWCKCRCIALNQGRNTKAKPAPQRFTSKGAFYFESYLIS